MGTRKGIKVIMAVIGFDGHTVGAEVVSKMLMGAGVEVVYLGIYQTPEMVVQAAIQEDADVIGISCHASNYARIEDLMDLLRKKDMTDVRVICGGNIPRQQIPKLKESGVAEVFTPQSASEAIINCIVSGVKGENGGSNK